MAGRAHELERIDAEPVGRDEAFLRRQQRRRAEQRLPASVGVFVAAQLKAHENPAQFIPPGMLARNDELRRFVASRARRPAVPTIHSALRTIVRPRTRRRRTVRPSARSGDSGSDSEPGEPSGEDPFGLPPLYSFQKFHRQHQHLEPAERLAAFVALPQSAQSQAWLDLRLRIAEARS